VTSQVCKIIRARDAGVDDCKGFSQLAGSPAETVSRINHQRTAYRKQRVSPLQRIKAGIHSCCGNSAAKKHYIGHQVTGAQLTPRQSQLENYLVRGLHVAVGPGGFLVWGGPLILALEQFLDTISTVHGRTHQATHTVNPAVQVDNVAAPCPLVESVHVLGYQKFDMAVF